MWSMGRGIVVKLLTEWTEIWAGEVGGGREGKRGGMTISESVGWCDGVR